MEEARRLTDGTGVDLVIDPVGSTLQASLCALAPEGRLVFLGNPGGGKLDVDPWQPMQSNQTLHGLFMGTIFERPSVHGTVDDLLAAAAAGKIDVVINRSFCARRRCEGASLRRDRQASRAGCDDHMNRERRATV
ncbi:zinc-binding dehydrogenase [Rhizobium sp. NFR07]|uniref:zinc-binding dehydrogenase n=1 Tax=Rhizobium sp. NFR07 TaxID=1566262 RepID=UPI001FCD7858|nr:zinc-binding dehydrogenase [Rhizobium sp. NFR07]